MEHADPRYELLNVGLLIPTPDNPRTIQENSESFAELLASVKAEGVKIPVVVRPHPTKKGYYDLRAGARRRLAAQKAKLKVIPSLIYDPMTDEEAFDITFLENFAREDLNPIEEARAVAILLEKHGNDLKVVADKFDKSLRWAKMRSHVHGNLSKKWTAAVLDEKTNISKNCTLSHLELVARFPKTVQEELFEEFEDLFWDEAPTLKRLTEACNNWIRSLKNAKWDPAEVFRTESGDEILACSVCPRRSSTQPMLWESDDEKTPKDDRCLDESCWNAKTVLWLKKDIESKKAQFPELVLIAYDASYHEKREMKKRFPELKEIDSWNTSKGKANDKDANPCYVVCGKFVNKVIWIKNSRSGSNSSSGSRAIGPKTMKVKRAELESKRWNHVLKELQIAYRKFGLDAIVREDTSYVLLCLVRHFGTCNDWGILETDWEEFEKTAKSVQVQTLETVWELVRPKIVKTFAYNDAITRVPESNIESAKAAAALVGIDIDTMFTAAVEAIPEPKSWASQEAAEKKRQPVKKKSVNKKKTIPKTSAANKTIKKKKTAKKKAAFSG